MRNFRVDRFVVGGGDDTNCRVEIACVEFTLFDYERLIFSHFQNPLSDLRCDHAQLATGAQQQFGLARGDRTAADDEAMLILDIVENGQKVHRNPVQYPARL